MFKIQRLDLSVPIKLEGIIKQPKWDPTPPRIKPVHLGDYKNLIPMGIVPAGSNLKDGLPYERYLHPISTKIDNRYFTKLRELAGDKFYMSVPTKENIRFSIRTFEDKPPVGYMSEHDKKVQFLAVNFLDQQYGHLFNNCISDSEEIASYIDWSKSAGYPMNQQGFRNKAQLIQDKNFQEYMFNQAYLKTIPIWSVHPKKEFKELEDLKNLKIRLFTIPPYPLLFEQLRFGKKVSEKLKGFEWSAYGFNPYNGGANQLATSLLQYDIILFYDVKGWDKFLSILHHVWGVAYKHSNIPDHLQENFIWTLKNTSDYYFKTPDGQVFLKNYGNPSGSGTTTRDNILAHVIIIAHALMEAYFQKVGKIPTRDVLLAQFVKIFGDDNILGLTSNFSYMLNDNFLESHFHKYGLSLKFKYGGFGYDIEKAQFLGFTFKKKDNFYYPLYDIQRLATSFLYQGDSSKNREAYISRAFTLMVMSFPSEHYETFRGAFQSICDYVGSENLTSTERSFVNMRNIDTHEIQSLFTGQESMIDFSFFLSVDGWRKETKETWPITA